MSCSVAISSSPAFSPSMVSLSCKTSPESLCFSLTQHHVSSSPAIDGSPSTASASTSSSPFRRFHRVPSGLRICKNENSACSSPGLDLSVVSPASSSSTSPCGSATFAKRKRPARLDIPIMGVLGFDQPPGSDGKQEMEEESDRYSVYCKRGRKRVDMEDRHSAALDLRGDPQMAFFGIFDGHGGSKAAEYVSRRIGERILEEVTMRGGEADMEVEEAVKNGYLKTDAEFLKEGVAGGACCVTAFVKKGELIVSNAGDCRAVLSISGTAEALTSDHRPSRDDEKDRIESLGGYVDCYRGVWRLQGSLAVSRGIGDSHLKQWVIPNPETRIIRIESNSEFLILASDGLWDKVDNQEAIDIARPLCLDSQKPSLLSACKKLVELSISRGSMDDISVMIIQLGHFFQG
ncbi:probable protein phosphatase 2C 25 [Phalaenopsis equestris]|uniref:probable protein phosphatase 2C 25 n=1 Tax=Phalaenopsis equestris TaxID=78828 RepID=UPI0009E52D50|nr:probable protein phosphatase 2C 25 [Phalaenopsis equestris]